MLFGVCNYGYKLQAIETVLIKCKPVKNADQKILSA